MTPSDVALLFVVGVVLVLLIRAMGIQSQMSANQNRILAVLTQHKADADKMFQLVEKQSRALTWSDGGCEKAICQLGEQIGRRLDDQDRKLDALAGRGG